MRSLVGNTILLLVGGFFVVLGGGLGLQARRDGIWEAYPIVFGTIYLSLGIWCGAGAVRNFLKFRELRRTPVTAGDRLITRYLAVLAAVLAIYLTLIYLHPASAPFGRGLMILHYSVVAMFVAIPLILITALASRPRPGDDAEAEKNDHGE